MEQNVEKLNNNVKNENLVIENKDNSNSYIQSGNYF